MWSFGKASKQTHAGEENLSIEKTPILPGSLTHLICWFFQVLLTADCSAVTSRIYVTYVFTAHAQRDVRYVYNTHA